MKKQAFFLMAVAALPLALTADVETANTFGLLKVTSSAKRTIVSVPWIDCGTGTEQGICVSNVVKTANLKAGDTLNVIKSSGVYQTWVLTKNDSDNTLYWKSTKLVNAEGVTVSGDPDVERIERGSALVLMRENPESCFYLFGQVASSGSVTYEIPFRGTSEAPAYSFIAPPTSTNQVVNGTGVTWSNVGANDRLIMVATDGTTGSVLYWKSSESKWYSTYTGKAYTGSIRTGQGVWYASYGNEGDAPSVTWSANVPHTGD